MVRVDPFLHFPPYSRPLHLASPSRFFTSTPKLFASHVLLSYSSSRSSSALFLSLSRCLSLTRASAPPDSWSYFPSPLSFLTLVLFHNIRIFSYLVSLSLAISKPFTPSQEDSQNASIYLLRKIKRLTQDPYSKEWRIRTKSG